MAEELGALEVVEVAQVQEPAAVVEPGRAEELEGREVVEAARVREPAAVVVLVEAEELGVDLEVAGREVVAPVEGAEEDWVVAAG